MDDTAKYLIHATISADGVVERSDVVGAVFGQTEGLLGDELDLRDLQQSSKVGRIDVTIESEGGQSFGEITITSSLDKVETSILAASLETITRVGPCRAAVEVTDIEDVRAAKRREVVERAKELLAQTFDDSVMTSQEILAEVRESVRVEDITRYRGFPAGPHVADSDAIIIVEGRADVLQLLRYGVKNAIAVEGTNVPDEVADLTRDRTVTAFLDGDRGGELILRELEQVGDVDYVAFAPENASVEDLSRADLMSALRNKIPYETVVERREDGPEEEDEGASADVAADTDADADAPVEDPTPAADADADAVAATDGSAHPAPETQSDSESRTDSPESPESPAEPTVSDDADSTEESVPQTLSGHVADVVDGATGRARLLDADFDVVAEVDADELFEALVDADAAPYAVVVDAEVSQRVLDVAAQREVEHLVGSGRGGFVKQPTTPRVRTAAEFGAD